MLVRLERLARRGVEGTRAQKRVSRLNFERRHGARTEDRLLICGREDVLVEAGRVRGRLVESADICEGSPRQQSTS